LRLARRPRRGLQDPKWLEFVGKGGPMLAEMHSVLLLPTSYSKSK